MQSYKADNTTWPSRMIPLLWEYLRQATDRLSSMDSRNLNLDLEVVAEVSIFLYYLLTSWLDMAERARSRRLVLSSPARGKRFITNHSTTYTTDQIHTLVKLAPWFGELPPIHSHLGHDGDNVFANILVLETTLQAKKSDILSCIASPRSQGFLIWLCCLQYD